MIEFISYDGVWPNLCSGVLKLNINDKVWSFGYGEDCESICFWMSGGKCGFSSDYSESDCNTAPWEIIKSSLPDELTPYAKEIADVFNKNVPWGCCGGCL